MTAISRSEFSTWNIRQPSQRMERFSVQKTFPDGIDVIISIFEVENGYEVRTSAEARTSGPVETAEEVAQTLAEAIDLSAKECRGWDEMI